MKYAYLKDGTEIIYEYDVASIDLVVEDLEVINKAVAMGEQSGRMPSCEFHPGLTWGLSLTFKAINDEFTKEQRAKESKINTLESCEVTIKYSATTGYIDEQNYRHAGYDEPFTEHANTSIRKEPR